MINLLLTIAAVLFVFALLIDLMSAKHDRNP